MDNYTSMLSFLSTGEALERLKALYGSREAELKRQAARYAGLVKKHEALFHSSGRILMVSAPGRIEIAGNHTDHNNGRVLAAAVSLDCLAAVAPRQDMKVRVLSEGFSPVETDLTDTSVREEDKGTSASLIRGVADGMMQNGMKIGGFDAVVTSDVVTGSGLSSSAAYEVMIAQILDALYNGRTLDPILRARIAQYAENVHFGKPSGLMDQMASSVGGMVTIDFKDEPRVEGLPFRFSNSGYDIVVVNTGSSHDNLTDEYASIRLEMNEVAAFFGKSVLRQVDAGDVWRNLKALRERLGERPVLRAIHYFNENERVGKLVEDVKIGDAERVLEGMIASGDSSQKLLQNVYVAGRSQPMTLALTLAESMLKGRGAWRVHGGGFAGTTLNVVPRDMTEEFTRRMNEVFGDGACFILDVRPEGGTVALESPEM